MNNGRLSFKEILTLHYKEIIFMRDAGVKSGKIVAYISKKENTVIKYDVLHRFYKELEDPLKLEKIKANAITLELMRSEDPDAFSFLHSNPAPSVAPMQSVQPQARPQASQTPSFGEPTFGAPNTSRQAETAQIPTLQKDTPNPLRNHAQNQGFGSTSQTHPPKGVEMGEFEARGLQKDTPNPLKNHMQNHRLGSASQTHPPKGVEMGEIEAGGLQKDTPNALKNHTQNQWFGSAPQTHTPRSVEEEIFELLNTRRTAHSKEDPTPRTSLPLYEKYKGRGFSRALDARQIELSAAAFGSSEFELEDIRDQLRTALIESRPTYSEEALREIYPDVLQVFKHTPTHRQQLKDKIRMLVEFREVRLDREEYYSLEDASSVIGVQIVSRRLMLAIILAYKEIYETKEQK